MDDRIAQFRRALLFCMLVYWPTLGHAICVKGERANLRKGPNTKYRKTWEVFKYMPLRPLGEKGNWTRVKDVDGQNHWIYTKLTTKAYLCAVVKAEKANLRTGPGTNYRIVKDSSPAVKYSSFRFLKQKKGWAKVKDTYSDVYWISRRLIWVY